MLAIPVFRARVAPVLDWCSKILVLPEHKVDRASGREIVLLRTNIFDLLRILQNEGVETLICGALSSEVLSFGKHLGMQIIYGVAGDIDEVLCAYHEEQLDQPCFRLPGCRGKRQYRKGKACEGNRTTDCPDEEGRTGPGGFCVCPHCGTRVGHEQGIPCTQVRCSECNAPMMRERSVPYKPI